MQGSCYKKIVRIISFSLAFCLCLAFVPVGISAEETDPSAEFTDRSVYVCDVWEMWWNVHLAMLTDTLFSSYADSDFYYFNSALLHEPTYCEAAAVATNGLMLWHVSDASSTRLRNSSCKYCGKSFDEVFVDIAMSYETTVEDLDYTTVSDQGLFYLYPSGWHFTYGNGVYVNPSYLTSEKGGFSFSGAALSALDEDTTYAYVSSASFSLPSGAYNLHLTDYSGLSSYGGGLYSSYTYKITLEGRDFGGSWVGVTSAYYKTVTYSGTYDYSTISFSTIDYPYDEYRVYAYFTSGYSSYSPGATLEGSRYGYIEAVALQEASAGKDDRVSSLIQALADYNYANNFQNGSSVNYYLCSCDDDDNSDLYTPALYDEETLIFTEPVTGAQYQSTGWTYDYTTRSYDIELEAGTFLIDDTDITGILCTYGDDGVTIVYSDADGAVVQTDEYNYVMVASSSCSLYGHSYAVETTKEPTCTSTGERVYTCSVCGDQKVEDVPANAHTSVYSVFKDATCTDSGVALYTCSVCGTQYTETIDALGHDWLSTDHVDTVYALPTDTACPDCGGVEFTCILDQDTAAYTCSCAACGASWTVSAEVTAGYTAYKCSRCGVKKTEYEGDEGDGLFQSVGSFFADGINWCVEKLRQLVDNLNTITEQFNAYLDDLAEKGGVFPEFFGALIALIPEDLMALLWFSLVALVLLFVYKKWLE